jgi:thiol-disulfide isomerase/thioredoxin
LSIFKPYVYNRLRLSILSLLFFSDFFGQSLIDSVISHYQNPVLSYSIYETYYASDNSKLESSGVIYSIIEKSSIHYLNNYKSKGQNLDVIKNSKYFGCNNYTQNYYEDFKANPLFEKSNIANGRWIFKQDSALIKQFLDTNYRVKAYRLKDHYLIDIVNSKEFQTESNIGETTHKYNAIKFYISKNNYSIFKTFTYFWIKIGGFDIKDSSIITYQELGLTKEQVRNKINSFKPIKRLKPAPTISNNFSNDSLKKFPYFALPDSSGTKIKSSDIKSKYVMIDFWYRSCAPCMANMPNIEKIRKRFGREDLEIIAINSYDKLGSSIKDDIKKLNKTFLFLFDGKELANLLNINSYPTTIIYDNSSRKIILWHTGTGENFSDLISTFLKDYIR